MQQWSTKHQVAQLIIIAIVAVVYTQNQSCPVKLNEMFQNAQYILICITYIMRLFWRHWSAFLMIMRVYQSNSTYKVQTHIYQHLSVAAIRLQTYNCGCCIAVINNYARIKCFSIRQYIIKHTNSIAINIKHHWDWTMDIGNNIIHHFKFYMQFWHQFTEKISFKE